VATSTGVQSAGDEGVLAALAARALELTRAATVIGLGTGRAASAFIQALGLEARAGRAIRGVPTSEATARLATAMGIPLVGLDEGPLDVTVDGADEVDPDLDLIKGYGGALVRERIVAAAARRQLILVDATKLVPVLGSRGRLPVEVLPFALPFCCRRLRELGFEPEVRILDGRPFVSDNCNAVVDCAVGPIRDAPGLDRRLRAIPGVLDTGLFLGTADAVLVAEAGAVRELGRRRNSNADGGARMTCKETIEVLMEYLEATLSSDVNQELERHLSACPPCQAYLNTYRKTADLAGQVGRQEMPEEMKRHLREFLLAQLGKHGD
jgi:ribose 5-phosphate isomerase A